MTLFTTAGSRFYIGDMRPDWGARPVTVADFAGEHWTQISSVENMGQLSSDWSLTDVSAPNPYNPDGPIIQTLIKTGRNAARMQLVMAWKKDDAGQAMLADAESSVEHFAFRIVFNDAPEGGAASERQFIASVVALSQGMDVANSILTLSAELLVQSTILRVGGDQV